LKTDTIFPILAQNLTYLCQQILNQLSYVILQIEDYKQLKSMIESYPEMEESFWREDQIELY
jgi:hypothetical protein